MKGESIKCFGQLRIREKDPEGNVVRHWDLGKNEITDAGFDFIADVIGNPAQPADMDYIGIGWGTGANTAFDPTQTDLQGASTDRNAATYAHTTGTKTFTLTASWGNGDPSASPITIEESGCFNAASGGTMLNRKTFTGIVKQPANTLEIEWTFTLS